MAYTKFRTEWKNLPDQTTPVNAEALNHVESGLDDAADVADAAQAHVGSTANPHGVTAGQAGAVINATTHGSSGTDITLNLSGVPAENSGTLGMKLARNQVDWPAGLTLRGPLVAESPGGTIRDQWDVVTLDAGTNDLILYGDHWANGETGTRLFGDQFRIRHGCHAEIGIGVGLQSVQRRLEISSKSHDNPSMTHLLVLRMEATSPVTMPVRIADGEWGSLTDLFTVTRAGAVTSAGIVTSKGGLRTEGSAVGAATSIVLANLGTGGKQYRIQSGVEGVGQTGLNFRDTSVGRNLLTITGGGSVILGPAGSLAVGATDGFTHLPRLAGAPTGVPTAWAGSVPVAVDESGNRLWAYMGGVWKSVTLA